MRRYRKIKSIQAIDINYILSIEKIFLMSLLNQQLKRGVCSVKI